VAGAGDGDTGDECAGLTGRVPVAVTVTVGAGVGIAAGWVVCAGVAVATGEVVRPGFAPVHPDRVNKTSRSRTSTTGIRRFISGILSS
jgi:hypothetical protein